MAKQTFTTGQVLTAAQMTDLQQTAMTGGAASTKTVSYVLVAADAGTRVAMNAAGSTTITVNTGLFSAGDTVSIQNIGAGVCTVTAGTATVNTSGSLVLAQYQGGILYFTSASAAIFFQFATPASGDIEGVTAGVGISGGGTSGTVTITNSMATTIDAAGDIIYGTGNDAFTKLSIGTAGQVLKVNSGATAPEWGAAGASALTFITSYAFSNVASAIIDGCFTSTYSSYLINIEKIGAATANDDFQMQLRYSSTTQTAAYYGASGGGKYDSATFQNAQNNNTNQFTISTDIGESVNQISSGFLIISKVGASGAPSWVGSFIDSAAATTRNFGGYIDATQTFTGILFKTSSTNIYGTIRVYGLAKS